LRVAARRLVTPGRLIAAGVILLGVVFTLWAVPSNQYLFLPDPARPVDPLVTVAGSHERHDDGGVYFVDVLVQKASLLDRLLPSLHNGADLYPASAVVGPGLSSSQEHDLDQAEMLQSQQVAAAVAFRALGKKVTLVPTGATVEDLQSGSPAASKLAPGDVIVAADGKRVRSPADLALVMRTKRVGATVALTIKRGGTEKVVKLRTIAGSPGSKRSIVGVFLSQAEDIRLPQRVSIDANGVVGPSAGLAFALDVLEKLGRDVDRGNKIAATGEIHLDGQVGAIGGIKQKTIGAREAHVDAFLVPAGANAREARKYAHGLRIIPVKSFQQALHALATLPAAR
jgi:PDZ domain-containing protein